MPVSPETGEWIDPPREECEIKPRYVRDLKVLALITLGAVLLCTFIDVAGGEPIIRSLAWALLVGCLWFPVLGFWVVVNSYRKEKTLEALEAKAEALSREQALSPGFREWLKEAHRRLVEEGIISS